MEMSPHTKQAFVLFAIATLIATLLPTANVRSTGLEVDTDACCRSDAEPDPATDTCPTKGTPPDHGPELGGSERTTHAGCENVSRRDAPVETRCCQSGCDDCFLPCCSGLISLEASSIVVGTDAVASAIPASRCHSFPSADPGAIDHPPRR